MPMKKLEDEFTKALHEKIPHRAELVKRVSDILHVEKESVSRRLKGDVRFSIDEMGKLAGELGISLDPLLRKEDAEQRLPMILEPPGSQQSITSLADRMEANLADFAELASAPFEFSHVFGSLPMDIVVNYNTLMKLFIFKWGHWFIGSEEFDDFGSWIMPDRFNTIKARYRNFRHAQARFTYIWDESMIWILVKEIDYFIKAGIIDEVNLGVIQNELHRVLSDFENHLRDIDNHPYQNVEMEFYVSTVHVGVNSWSLVSEKGRAAFFETHFSRTPVDHEPQLCASIAKWINSLKKTSFRASGSGQKDRRLFFQEQHRIIDATLSRA